MTNKEKILKLLSDGEARHMKVIAAELKLNPGSVATTCAALRRSGLLILAEKTVSYHVPGYYKLNPAFKKKGKK